MGAVVLDTSLLVALTDRSDVHHAGARAAISGARRDHDLWISTITFSELMVGVLSGQGDPERLDRLVDRLGVSMMPVTPAVAAVGARLRVANRGLKLPDALVIATGVLLEAVQVLTSDRRWERVHPAVSVISPSP